MDSLKSVQTKHEILKLYIEIFGKHPDPIQYKHLFNKGTVADAKNNFINQVAQRVIANHKLILNSEPKNAEADAYTDSVIKKYLTFIDLNKFFISVKSGYDTKNFRLFLDQNAPTSRVSQSIDTSVSTSVSTSVTAVSPLVTSVPPAINVLPINIKEIDKQYDTKRRKNILVVADVKDWCFDNIAKEIKKYFDTHNIYIEYCTLNPTYEIYARINIDLIIKLWYCYDKVDPFVLFPNSKKAICVYDYLYWNKENNRAYNNIATKSLTKNIAAADYILYGCPTIKELLVKQFGASLLADKFLSPVFDGVDIKKFYFKEYTHLNANGKLRVGWVGNVFNVYKRYHLLKNAVSNCEWIELKLQDKKNFISHDQMVGYYHGIDVLVCLSEAEGTPNPVLEASSCGRTWVSTNVGLVSSLYGMAGGETKPGIIINDTAELVSKLRLLFENPHIMRAMGRTARECIEKNFSWSTRIKQFEAVCNSFP